MGGGVATVLGEGLGRAPAPISALPEPPWPHLHPRPVLHRGGREGVGLAKVPHQGHIHADSTPRGAPMADYDYDLFVIGAGSGGVRAARLAAMTGARVGVAEEYRVGGTCVIRGCVPKKFMVYASEFSQQVKTARGFGWTVEEPTFDCRPSSRPRTSRSRGCRASMSPTCRRPALTCCTAGRSSRTPTPSRSPARTPAPSRRRKYSSPPAAGRPIRRTCPASSTPSARTRLSISNPCQRAS